MARQTTQRLPFHCNPNRGENHARRAIKTQLSAYLEKLQTPIELVASLDDSDAARQMRELLADIAALSPKVSVREDGNDARKPSFSVGRPARRPHPLRRHPDGPRIHLAGAGAVAGPAATRPRSMRR
jgi:hypothetical protein